MGGTIDAVHRDSEHRVTKLTQPSIQLIEGQGVEGDAHAGATVKHRSRLALHRTKPNLRQVHLIHSELHDELREAGYPVGPGVMGENITTIGIDLLGLPTGTRLRLGETAMVEVTGLRSPCKQLNGIKDGLMSAVLDRDEEGNLIRKAGIMSIVITSGEVRPGDLIDVQLPAAPHSPLQPV